MKNAIIIQARMSSSRLPGKVLMDVGGEVLLARVIKRLSLSQVAPMIVATSVDSEDEAIVQYCKKNDISFARGDLNNVAQRFTQVVTKEKLDAFVRISADSPLIDYRLVDACWQEFSNGAYDIVTNCMKRTFPKGQSVEIIGAKFFLNHIKQLVAKEDTEHVTQYFYNHPYSFRIKNIESGRDAGNINLCVDTRDDLLRMTNIILKLGARAQNCTWQDAMFAHQQVVSEVRA